MQQAPPPEAPFADKMAYYRTQHTSKGVRATHLVGIPIIAAGIPLIFAKPKVGSTMFIGGWAMQIVGHRLFEKNLCEQYGEMLARRSQRRVGMR